MQAPRSVTKTPVRRAAPDLDEDEDGEEEYQSFVPIDELLAQGINQGDIDKLKGAGVATVDRLVNATTTKVLLAIKGITEAKIVKLKEAGKKLCLRVPGCAGACCAPYSPLFPYPHSRSLTPHAPTPKKALPHRPRRPGPPQARRPDLHGRGRRQQDPRRRR